MIASSTKPRSKEASMPPGFTLMEILLAILIVTILFTTIYGAWATVSSTSRAVTDDIVDYEMAEICLNRMVMDLQGLFIAQRPAYVDPEPDSDPDPYQVHGTVGDPAAPFSGLRFTARSHLAMGDETKNGIAQILYYLDSQNHEPPFAIRRADTLFPFDTPEPRPTDPILCERVQELTFTFYDQDGETHDQWNSESDDTGYATPRAVGIDLKIGSKEAPKRFETMIVFPLYRDKKELR